jgi:glucuronoarabinoxylan endo-1,4-beta-xylanase
MESVRVKCLSLLLALAIWHTLTGAAAAASVACTVDWGTVFQHIDGFGASSAYRGTWTTAQENMFFSTNSGTGVSLDGKTNFAFVGCGFSLLRSKISYNDSSNSAAIPTTVETTIMQRAAALGAKVWSAPWTPPRGFKDSFATNGGNYLGSGNNATNLAYASQLANYVASMKISYGVTLYALSIQNEPDHNTSDYEACVWSGAQFHDFATNLYAALVAKGVGSTKIMLPESANWGSINPGLYTPALGDPAVAPDVGIIGNHDYVPDNVTGDLTTPAALSVSSKPSWETEVSQENGAYDGSITNALYWAGRIHLFMTVAQANAWHYWWLMSYNPDNEGLTDDNGVPAKRMYALGQFARFVRPNFYRINIAQNTGAAQISAYKDSVSSNFAIVAINSSSAAITQMFTLTNVTGVNSVTPWLTSGSFSLTNLPSVAVASSNFTYTLPAMSIVTFSGKSGTNTPPAFAAIASQTINPGATLILTNAATDTDAPPQVLTYALLTGPTNATLGATNGLFNWRPLLSQASTTNLVTVQATDNGMPNLSATNTFNITVNPVVTPAVSANLGGSGSVNIAITGAPGPDCSLLVSSNLTTWQILFTTNSPLLPVTFVDTNSGTLPARFYRVQIGP